MHYSVHPGKSPPSYAVRMKQHHAQKRLREMKRASWRSYCEQSPEFIENQAHKPLAHGSAADVVDRFISDVVLTVGQENQDRRSIVSHMSVYQAFFQKMFLYLSVLQCAFIIFCALSRARVKSVQPSASNRKAAVNSSSGELAKSFSIEVTGS